MSPRRRGRGGAGGGGGGGGGQQGQGQGRQPARRHGVDLWRPVPQLPEIEPIAPPTDPTALLRSLGDPPLQGQGAVAGHYLAAVVEQASNLAVALAAATGVLASTGDD